MAYWKGGYLVRIINRKWWLTSIALLLLLPAAFAKPENSHQRHRQSLADPPALTVPEGGSALVYVVGAGITCLGAMVVRSRSARPKQL
jgi:hypothetical protein